MRQVLSVLVLLLTCSCLSGVRSISAEIESSAYFPLALGNRWVYESSEGTAEMPALESWEVIRQEGAAFVVRIQQPFVTVGGLEEQFTVAAEGITRRIQDADAQEPQLILKVPPTVDARWQSGDGQYAITALGKTVTTPAGAFPDCVEVTRWNQASKVAVVSTYAPGVGLIQREESFPIIGGLGGFESATRGRTVLKLKEWTIKTPEAASQQEGPKQTSGGE